MVTCIVVVLLNESDPLPVRFRVSPHFFCIFLLQSEMIKTDSLMIISGLAAADLECVDFLLR